MSVEIERLARRLKAAKARALYWSGNPSFSSNRFVPGSRGRRFDHSMEYEMALSDIEGLTMAMNRIDGRQRKIYDPKATFQKRFSEATTTRRTGK